MRRISASHRNGIGLIFQAIVGLIADGRFGALAHELGAKAAALNHEAIDHAVEQRVAVKAARLPPYNLMTSDSLS